jgi:hypothetical protein
VPIAGEADRRPLAPVVYWRRRLLVALAVGLLLIGGVDLVGRAAAFVGGRRAPADQTVGLTGIDGRSGVPASVAAAASPSAVDGETYVVEPGDSLWTIAQKLKPGGDPRPVVDELSRRAGGSALRPGQHLQLRGIR